MGGGISRYFISSVTFSSSKSVLQTQIESSEVNFTARSTALSMARKPTEGIL